MALPSPKVAALLAPMWKKLIEDCPPENLEVLIRHIQASNGYHRKPNHPKPIGPRGLKRTL